jgi:solute carrier family 35 protein E1
MLPSPALSSKKGILGTLMSVIGERLAPTSNATRNHSSLTSRADGLSWLRPSWSTIRFVSLCSLWYTSSAMSSNTGKVIMNAYRYPVTLTIIQFFFVASYSVLCCQPMLGMTTMRKPTRAIVRSTLPMAVFQVGGHVFSSVAISRIPVSTVHTIKVSIIQPSRTCQSQRTDTSYQALSPMFTVAAYAVLFGVQYSPATYISLLPLTAGVMLACSFDVSASDFVGLTSAFGSAIVFVSSNIFFKKVMPTQTEKGGLTGAPTSHKLDKLNLLLYSSSFAFLLMIPVWIYNDLPRLLSGEGSTTAASKVSVSYYYFLNGTVHFGQNILAFVILASTSPVTYSIAALVKRIAVICIAVVWFAQAIHPMQGLGICLTFVGLWMYNNAKSDVERGERKARKVEAQAALLLPNTAREGEIYRGGESPTSVSPREAPAMLPPFALSSVVPRPAYIQQTSAAVPSTESTAQNHHPHYHPHLHNHYTAHHTHPVPMPPPRHLASVPPPLILANLESAKNVVASPTGSYPSPPPSVGPVSPPMLYRATSHEQKAQ